MISADLPQDKDAATASLVLGGAFTVLLSASTALHQIELVKKTLPTPGFSAFTFTVDTLLQISQFPAGVLATLGKTPLPAATGAIREALEHAQQAARLELFIWAYQWIPVLNDGPKRLFSISLPWPVIAVYGIGHLICFFTLMGLDLASLRALDAMAPRDAAGQTIPGTIERMLSMTGESVGNATSTFPEMMPKIEGNLFMESVVLEAGNLTWFLTSLARYIAALDDSTPETPCAYLPR